MFPLHRLLMGYFVLEGKEQFYPVGHEEISLQAGVTLIGGSIEEMPLAYKNISTGDATPRDIGRSARQIHAAHCKDE